jgi:hypothetical protein
MPGHAGRKGQRRNSNDLTAHLNHVYKTTWTMGDNWMPRLKDPRKR